MGIKLRLELSRLPVPSGEPYIFCLYPRTLVRERKKQNKTYEQRLLATGEGDGGSNAHLLSNSFVAIGLQLLGCDLAKISSIFHQTV